MKRLKEKWKRISAIGLCMAMILSNSSISSFAESSALGQVESSETGAQTELPVPIVKYQSMNLYDYINEEIPLIDKNDDVDKLKSLEKGAVTVLFHIIPKRDNSEEHILFSISDKEQSDKYIKFYVTPRIFGLDGTARIGVEGVDGMGHQYVDVPNSSLRYLNSNEWHTVTYNFTGTSLQIYLNGVQIGNDIIDGIGMFQNSQWTANAVSIGGIQKANSSQAQFQGGIEYLRVDDEPLTESQIQLIHESTNVPAYPETEYPTGSSVRIDGNADAELKAGDRLIFEIETSDIMFLVGNIKMALYIGGSYCYADYVSGSGTKHLVFEYIVQQEDVGDIYTDFYHIRDNSGIGISDAYGRGLSTKPCHVGYVKKASSDNSDDIPKENMTALSDNVFEDNIASNVLDGLEDTIWRTNEDDFNVDITNGWITLQFKDGAVHDISGLRYLPKQDAGVGNDDNYPYPVNASFETSMDGINYSRIDTTNRYGYSTMWVRDSSWKRVDFPYPTKARYLRMRVRSIEDNFVSAAEIRLIGKEAERRNLTGHVTFGEWEPPVDSLEGVKVIARGGGEVRETVVTNAEGEYVIENLLEGVSYTVEAEKEGYFCNGRVITIGEDSDKLDVVLNAYTVCTIYGTVEDETFAPLEGASVVIKSDGKVIESISTDAAGQFTTGMLPQGTYTMEVSKPGYDTYKEEIAAYGESGSHGFSFIARLAKLEGSLSGVVTEEGIPLTDVTVTIEKDGTSVTDTTDENGAYSFEGLIYGDYEISFAKKGYVVKEENISIASETSTLDAVLVRLTGILKGTVKEGTEPLEGVTITVKLENVIVAESVTGADGQYIIADLPYGTYTAVFVKEGYEMENVENVVIDEEHKEVILDVIMGDTGVEKAVLEARVKELTKLDETLYTPESWESFAKALDDAKAVLENVKATIPQIRKALDELNKQAENLKPIEEPDESVNKQALKNAIDTYSKLKEENYTAASWQSFEKALNEAEIVLADDKATQTEVDNALKLLNTKAEGLKVEVKIPTKGIEVEGLQETVLTEEDKAAIAEGKNIAVSVVADEKKPEEVDKEELSLIQNALTQNMELGTILDIRIEKQIEGQEVETVTELTKPVSITVDIPASLVNHNKNVQRTFYVVRLHEGAAEKLSVVDNNDETITFQTDKFSLYSIVYEDKKIEVTEGEKPGHTPENPTDVNDSDCDTKSPVQTPPKTADTTSTAGILFLMAIMAVIVMMICGKRKDMSN